MLILCGTWLGGPNIHRTIQCCPNCAPNSAPEQQSGWQQNVGTVPLYEYGSLPRSAGSREHRPRCKANRGTALQHCNFADIPNTTAQNCSKEISLLTTSYISFQGHVTKAFSSVLFDWTQTLAEQYSSALTEYFKIYGPFHKSHSFPRNATSVTFCNNTTNRRAGFSLDRKIHLAL